MKQFPVVSQPSRPLRIRLPFGCNDLDPIVANSSNNPGLVRCYVRGCHHYLRPPRRYRPGNVCPVHGIRCHRSSKGSTYSYASPRRNIIASPELFASRVIGHPFKYETHRLGNENSEDALTWNVFRSLLEVGMLGQLGEYITGIRAVIEPRLYLWGLEVTGDAIDPWSLLIAARERFEGNLPVERPLTEPDIALHLPGRYLILIEAKFTSPNTWYEFGPRQDGSSLTLEELLVIYQDPKLQILNLQRATRRDRVHYQLWRNMIFAEWMARLDHPNTRAFHVNLVRDGYEIESAAEFHGLLSPVMQDRFCRMTWEEIYGLVAAEPRVHLLRRYLQSKTAGLVRAFNLPRSGS